MSSILTQTNRGPNTSGAYKVITTQNVLDVFQSRGFEIERISQSRAIKTENVGFENHLVQMSVPESNAKFKIEGLQPKLYVRNGYNANTSLQIYFGVYRLVCSNGLVVGTNIFKNRVRHVGDIDTALNAAIDRSLNAFDLIASHINDWQSIKLNADQQLDLARRLTAIRLPQDTDKIKYRIETFSKLIQPSRIGDQNNDAFTVFNRIQERLLQRPKLTHYLAEAKNEHGIVTVQRKTLRSLSPANEVLINSKFWDATDSFLNGGVK